MTADNAGAGFHRRIRLYPYPGRIVAGLEDNLHRFTLQLTHADHRVTGIDVLAQRHPWTTCPGAAALLVEQAVGQRVEALARMDIFEHCTHLFELALMCAGHVDDRDVTQFDLHVDEWIEGRTQVRLLLDGAPVLTLAIDGRRIETPGAWFGRDVFGLSQPDQLLAPAAREHAMLIARAIYVSLGRAAPVVERAVDRGPRAVGVCYAYQPRRIGDARRVEHSRVEFAGSPRQPLDGFDPQTELS